MSNVSSNYLGSSRLSIPKAIIVRIPKYTSSTPLYNAEGGKKDERKYLLQKNQMKQLTEQIRLHLRRLKPLVLVPPPIMQF